jgi:leucyl/phenylalanyl-tRNA--protein transferase
VLPFDTFHVPSRLARVLRHGRFSTSVDRDFPAVMRACAADRDDGTWISQEIFETYVELHALGIAHSVEVWSGDQLAGGLYGVHLGGAFFGESMFHRAPDASKIALWALCDVLAARDFHLIDCQQETGHLATLGARPIALPEFRARLALAQQQPTLKGSWAQWRWGGP